MSRRSWSMKGWRTSSGRWPLWSRSSPDESIAMSACCRLPSRPRSSHWRTRRYQGRNRQFSCTMTRARPENALRQCLAFGERRGHGLLAENAEPMLGRDLHKCGMGCARGRYVDGVKAAVGKRVFQTRIDLGDTELLGAGTGLRRIRIADSNDLGAPLAGPSDQVIVADRPGARENHPQLSIATRPPIMRSRRSETGGPDCERAQSRGHARRGASEQAPRGSRRR